MPAEEGILWMASVEKKSIKNIDAYAESFLSHTEEGANGVIITGESMTYREIFTRFLVQ